MDTFIISNTIAIVLSFLVLHVLILPKFLQKEIFKGLIYIYFFSCLIVSLIILGGFYFSILTGYSTFDYFFVLIISIFFSSFLVLSYIMSFMGIMESSVRLRLLSEISNHPKGININDILKKYNKDVILKKRLERFIASGDVSKSGEYYQKENRFTAYTLPDLIIRIVWKLYGGAEV